MGKACSATSAPWARRSRDGGVVVGLGDVHGEVDVDAAAAALEADLGLPEADPGAVAGHHPDRVAVGPAVDDRQAEQARVERLGGFEVDDLEHEFANSGDRNAHGSEILPCPIAMVGRVEEFTPAERARLAPHFSNTDGPVFALVDLPETVKGAMFARYSRYPGTLRRLFLDEFADSLPERVGALDRDVEGARAAELFERIFVGFGDDSVAQLGGAHIAVEWCSNVLTKVLQRPRLASYLEQSTRYIAYDAPMPGGGYRYHRDAALGPEYEQAMDSLFGAYSQALPRVADWVDSTYPAAPGESEAVRRRAVKAKALDLLRGLLPAASLSHMGIYASGQAYEQLILHLLAHPLPEARVCGKRMLEAVKAVIPSFVARVERPGRGDVWVDYLSERRARRAPLGRAPGPGPRRGGRGALVRRARARRRRRGPPARRAALRGRRRRRRSARSRPSPRSARTSARGCWPSSSASARTAVTARAAASRRCATASRSSPTTAPSATCSATGCSPSSGSR